MPIKEKVVYPHFTPTPGFDNCLIPSQPHDHVLACGHIIVTDKPEPCGPNCWHITNGQHPTDNASEIAFWCDACVEEIIEEDVEPRDITSQAAEDRRAVLRAKLEKENRPTQSTMRKCYISGKNVSVRVDQENQLLRAYKPAKPTHPLDTIIPHAGSTSMFEYVTLKQIDVQQSEDDQAPNPSFMNKARTAGNRSRMSLGSKTANVAIANQNETGNGPRQDTRIPSSKERSGDPQPFRLMQVGKDKDIPVESLEKASSLLSKKRSGNALNARSRELSHEIGEETNDMTVQPLMKITQHRSKKRSAESTGGREATKRLENSVIDLTNEDESGEGVTEQQTQHRSKKRSAESTGGREATKHPRNSVVDLTTEDDDLTEDESGEGMTEQETQQIVEKASLPPSRKRGRYINAAVFDSSDNEEGIRPAVRSPFRGL